MARTRSSTTLLLLLATCLFLSTARAASSVLGIDIGTAYLKAVLVKPGIPLEIVLTKDSKRKEAAALAFKPSSSPSSSATDTFPERLYGGDALALTGRFPGDVFAHVKPLLGHAPEEHTTAELFQARYPGLTLETCGGAGAVCVRSGAAFGAAEAPFPVEELLAMQLANVRANAEAFAGAGSRVTDAVITVPAFYTAREKRAVEAAVNLAGLRVIAMTTDGLAVGLNYATTRTFPVVNEGGSPEYHLVYDMGAGSATATVLRFQGRSVKDVGRFNKTVQEVQVVGAGWDRQLGGDALNAVILDDMVAQLAKNKQMVALRVSAEQIRGHARTVAKLWKEAERLRQVLSANQETQASFEGIYDDDVTFRYKIKRADFERLAAEYAGRVQDPVTQALEMAKLEPSDIESVILHGGVVRTPFVQKALEKIIGKAEKLRTNVNSDESAAFGAAFKAAGLSPSFRVKEINAIEASVLPVTLSWNADGRTRQQKLFVPTSAAGVEKQIPLPKSDGGASFGLHQSISVAGGGETSVPVSAVRLTNLTVAIDKLREQYECDRDTLRAHILVRLSANDNLPEVVNGTVNCESTTAAKKGSVVDGVKGLFGWNKGDQKVLQDEESETGTPLKSIKAKGKVKSKSATGTASTTSAESPESTAEADATPKSKIVTAPFGIDITTPPAIPAAELPRLQARMKAFDASDLARMQRAEALNSLEGYTYKIRDLIDEEAFVAVSAPSERAVIEDRSRAASEWLYDDGADAPALDFAARLKQLKILVEPIQRRRDEAAQRPDQVEALKSAIQQTKSLLETLRQSVVQASIAAAEAAAASASASSSAAEPEVSVMGSPPDGAEERSGEASEATLNLEDLDDDPLASPAAAGTQASPSAMPEMMPLPEYSEEDLDKLEAASDAAEKWLQDKEVAQAKRNPTEDPAVLVKDLKAKGDELNRVMFELLSKQMKARQGAGGKSKGRSTKEKTEKAKTRPKGKGKGKSRSAEADAEKAEGENGRKNGGKDEL